VRISRKPTKEVLMGASGGCGIMLLIFIAFCLDITGIILASTNRMNDELRILILLVLSAFLVLGLIMFCGATTLDPNQGVVVLCCGIYRGTVKQNGCVWILPFLRTNKISYKSNNFESDTLKINDKRGNPIEVGAVITWKIYDSYNASFEVANLFEFVKTQSESAIRTLITRYPYDKFHDGEVSLKDGGDEINQELVQELQVHLDRAGVLVEEAKFNHMAYAPEIAQVMLRRQQADSIIEARQKIIQGAVGIVGMAVDSLKKNNIHDLDREETVKIVSNLLVVMCSESHDSSSVNIKSNRPIENIRRARTEMPKAIGSSDYSGSDPILSHLFNDPNYKLTGQFSPNLFQNYNINN